MKTCLFAGLNGTHIGIWFLGCLVWAAAMGSAVAKECRVAVIPAPPEAAPDTLLCDLLTVELGKQPDLALLERREIHRALAERELAGLAASGTVRERRELGQILKADLLLILARSTLNNKAQLRATLCDTQQGIRLFHGALVTDDVNVEQQVAWIVETVNATRQRFADGVSCIYGLSPFVSRSLTHDHDYLQHVLSGVLEGALLAMPGVAVVEIAEAHSIREELELTGGEVRRLLPVFVQGEFRGSCAATCEVAKVDVNVAALTPSGATNCWNRNGLTPEAAVGFLGRQVAPGLLKIYCGRTAAGFSEQQQAVALQEASRRFAQRGDWEESTALGEAALILAAPRAREVRIRLVEEYQLLLGTIPYRRIAWMEGMPCDGMNDNELTHYRITVYLRSLDHLEHLIQNRAITANQAWFLSALMFHNARKVTEGAAIDEAKSRLELLDRRRREFVRRLWTVFDLPSSAWPPRASFIGDGSVLYDSWAGAGVLKELDARAQTLFGFATVRLNREPDGSQGKTRSEDLELIAETAVQASTHMPGARGFWTLYRFLLIAPRRLHHSVTPEIYRAFLDRLERTEIPECEYHAKHGRFCFAYTQEISGMSMDASTGRYPLSDAAYARLKPYYQAACAASEETFGGRYSNALFAMPGDVKSGPKPLPPAECEPSTLLFDPVDITVLTLDGKQAPPGGVVREWKRAGPFDVAWSASSVYVMTEKGVLREIFALGRKDAEHGNQGNSVAKISDVAWDGESLWVQLGGDAGMLILDRTGKEAGRITKASGLPACDRRLILEPLAPGRVFAAGSFGPYSRAWCAILSCKPGQPSVEVIHEATHVRVAGAPLEGVQNDTDLAFTPVFVRRYDHGRKDCGPVVLVGRMVRDTSGGQSAEALWYHQSYELPALEVDVDDRRVRTTPFLVGSPMGPTGASYFDSNGRLFEITGALKVWAPKEGRSWYEGFNIGEIGLQGHLNMTHIKMDGGQVLLPGGLAWMPRGASGNRLEKQIMCCLLDLQSLTLRYFEAWGDAVPGDISWHESALYGVLCLVTKVRNPRQQPAYSTCTPRLMEPCFVETLRIPEAAGLGATVPGRDGLVSGSMTLIPAGAFVMGATTNVGHESISDAVPQHTVDVDAFYMDRCSVTKALWDDVYTWATNRGYTFQNKGEGKAENHPVHSVSWYDCVKWCNARSERDGFAPCYSAHGAVYRTGGATNVICDWNATGYRLPTEAEWEKAARGGLANARFPWGDQIDHTRANFNSSGDLPYNTETRFGGNHPDTRYPEPLTLPVASFAANGYGLYDMAGNVMQWCWDWYDATYYTNSPTANPTGPTLDIEALIGARQSPHMSVTMPIRDANHRVIRGGCGIFLSSYARCAYRGGFTPDHGYLNCGFRCTRRPRPIAALGRDGRTASSPRFSP